MDLLLAMQRNFNLRLVTLLLCTQLGGVGSVIPLPLVSHGVFFFPLGVRLVDGPTGYEGRVEIYYDGEWGTVCDDTMGNDEAGVFCAMMGYGATGEFLYTTYGSGTGRIWLDGFDCGYLDLDITQCSGISWGSHDCSHSEDASIRCTDTDPYSTPGINGVRLVDAYGDFQTIGSGYLQVQINGVWGTVCDDEFYDDEAEVFCRVMGYKDGGEATYSDSSSITSPILLDDVNCDSDVRSLGDCSHAGIGNHNCHHSEDVFLRCDGEGFAEESYESFTVALSMVSPDDDTLSGSPHVFRDGQYGHYCRTPSNYYRDDEAAARVMCRELGYEEGELLSSYPAAGVMLMKLLDCHGDEERVFDCGHSEIYINASSQDSYSNLECTDRFVIQCTGREDDSDAAITAIIAVFVVLGILGIIGGIIACCCYCGNKSDPNRPNTLQSGPNAVGPTRQRIQQQRSANNQTNMAIFTTQQQGQQPQGPPPPYPVQQQAYLTQQQVYPPQNPYPVHQHGYPPQNQYPVQQQPMVISQQMTTNQPPPPQNPSAPPPSYAEGQRMPPPPPTYNVLYSSQEAPQPAQPTYINPPPVTEEK